MTASEHPSPMQFYHGTIHDFEAGEIVDPSHPRLRVHVEPTGEYEEGPVEGRDSGAYITKHPVRVIEELEY
jgi:hypothetical protein